MTIPHIHVKDVDIPNIYVPDWMTRQPDVDRLVPPVVLNIGNPIVNIPGCVKMHRDNQYHNNGLPIDRNLVENDPDQAMILCDAEVPSYDAMNYEPEQLIITRETPPPPVAPPPDVETPEVPDTGNLAKDKEIECPAPNQPRVGDLTQNGEERVTGHEIQNGQCVVLYESTTTIEKYLPSTNQISTTAAIAVVATASAAATPLLLRVIKPIIKKATDTIRKKLGKGKKKEEQTPEQIAKKYKMKKLVITD